MDYQTLSLFFLIFYSFLFLYLDLKYQKIYNLISLSGIIIFLFLGYFSGFFSYYIWEFTIRTLVLFFVFYFLYLQGRLAGGDFKIYFVLTGFLLIYIFSHIDLTINWMYFDMYIIFYSLFFGFVFLVLRYIFLYIKKGFKLQIDPIIKLKFSNDRKDAVLHFTLLTRSLLYAFFYIFLSKYETGLLVFIIIILEFVFFGVFLAWLKDVSFTYLDWFIRKKEVKFVSILVFVVLAIYLLYLKHFALVFLLLAFTFLEYIVAILQLNFDTKIVKVKNLKGDEKLSIRNFPVNLTLQLNLADELELDEDVVELIKKNNLQNVEIITEVPYGVFLVIGILYFLWKSLLF